VALDHSLTRVYFDRLLGQFVGFETGLAGATCGSQKRSFMLIPDPTNRHVAHSAEWYAIYTRHQHEKSVAHILSTNGLEIFLPLYTAVHRWKDRNKELSLPLFPCYVFLRGGLERRWQILATPGVHALVGAAGHPSSIPQTEIDAVRQIVERSSQVEPYPFLKCGDWVRIKCGPLEGIEGILVRRKNLFRLILSVSMLQKSVAVEVDSTMVERVGHPQTEIAPWSRNQPVLANP
jgi:transcription antitermination factor NusG